MKRPILLSLLFAAACPAALMTMSPAKAQVTTNEDALPSAAPPPASTAPRKAGQLPEHTANRHLAAQTASPGTTHATPAHTTDTRTGTAAGAPVNSASTPTQAPAAQRVGLPPSVPSDPPRPVVIVPPSVDVPTHPPVQPEMVKASSDAKGDIHPIDKGLRVVFAPGSSLMTQAMIDAVTEAGKMLASKPGLRITLWSCASGSKDDLSTPRRIALARALAVRSILIRQGVATTRIYPRATGLAAEGVTPPDRLDIIAQGSVPAPRSEAQFGVIVQKAAK